MADSGPEIEAPVLPPSMTVDQAIGAETFLLEGRHGNLWFEYRSPTLFVTFDNLATLDDPYPRLPWMYARTEMLKASVLGVQTFRKDWFRQPTSSAQIAALAAAGFFDRFDRVVFMGASMGAFAALNFAPLVTGAWALVFSPQSTMNRTIAPFEKRFSYSVKRSNWEGMPFLDAAAAVPYIPKIAMFYDPLEMEDKRHATRLDGPNVQHLAFPCATHQAIRLVVKCDALPQMMQEFAETGTLGPKFFVRMRARKAVRSWRRALIHHLENRNHPLLVVRACDLMLADKHYAFAIDAKRRVMEEHPGLVS
ncbi:MAG: hypothetical protein AAF999_10320 [Pseudomonadota bacterium]